MNITDQLPILQQHKTLDVVTLFHKASAPGSVRVLGLLKGLSAKASATATEDQASDHTPRTEFELEVTEEPPTEDQLRNILQYLGPSSAGKVIKGATDEADALRKLKADGSTFERPLVHLPTLRTC